MSDAPQTTEIYCPGCDVELISSGYHLDTIEDEIEIYECQRCGHQSFWFFPAPAPILIGHTAIPRSETKHT